MMDGVRHRVHELAADARGAQGRAFPFVADLAYDIDRQFEGSRRNFFAGLAKAARFGECDLAVILEPRVAPAVIVVQLALCDPFEQALEMIQAMPVMTADRGVEDSRQPSGVAIVVDRVQEFLALAQNFERGGDCRRAR
jgi:hypothetical protein